MNGTNNGTAGPSLLVFSDDWGRHPSSCQHLVRRLGRRYSVRWVNTIGMRMPRFDMTTLRRGCEKLRSWTFRSGPVVAETDVSTAELLDFAVISPRMWPWFTRPFDRRLNRSLLERQLEPVLADLPRPVVGVTTVPIAADLVGRLSVDRWVYYCVDDFSVWPGLDGETLQRMDADLVGRVDSVVAVSEVLRDRVRRFGRDAELLTHGIDLDHWRRADASRQPSEIDSVPGPIALFWGVIDRRMDVSFVQSIVERFDGTALLVGPQDNPDPALERMDRVRLLPPVPYAELPSWAAAADVLVMPYADLPVTRAMQPLKLKEYLATGKPVVARDLPAVREWADALDVATTAEQFARQVMTRAGTGIPVDQERARTRLVDETWDRKAEQFAKQLFDDRDVSNRPAPSLVGAMP